MYEIKAMNERLTFSWGHIIAFIALIAVSYVSFVGFTYLTAGNFLFGAIGMGVTDIVFIFVFIGAQQLKASGSAMRKKIRWERVLIFGSPLIFAAGMVAMSHFWSVQSRNDDVVANFNGALNHGKGIFTEYETYANGRLTNYGKSLDKIVAERLTNPTNYLKAGFTPGQEAMQKANMMEVLRLQLLSTNYDSLKNLANKWIDNANEGASTFNVFLIGNTEEISRALTNWETQLKDFSKKKLSNEEILFGVTDFESTSGSAAAQEIRNLGQSFTKQQIPTVNAIIFGVIVYLMMIFPYFIQERHSKSVYTLGGQRKDPDAFEEVKTKEKYKEDSDFPIF